MRAVSAGRLVTVELALVTAVGAAAAGSGWLVAAVPPVAIAVIAALTRVRGEPTYRWLGTYGAYLARPRHLPSDPLAWSGAGAVPVAAGIEDEYGATGLLELGDPTALTVPAELRVPAPAVLLGDGPGVRAQLVTFTVPPLLPGVRTAARHRVLVAVRAVRTPGDDPAGTLARALRRVSRTLERAGVPHVPVDGSAAATVLADLSRPDAGQPLVHGAPPVPGRPATESPGPRETWTGLADGRLWQVCLRLHRWPDELEPADLIRLFHARVACAWSLPDRGTPTVRLAAADRAAVESAVSALRSAVETAGGELRRMDGRQIDGMIATLPLGITDAADDGRAITLPFGAGPLVDGLLVHGAPADASAAPYVSAASEASRLTPAGSPAPDRLSPATTGHTALQARPAGKGRPGEARPAGEAHPGEADPAAAEAGAPAGASPRASDPDAGDVPALTRAGLLPPLPGVTTTGRTAFPDRNRSALSRSGGPSRRPPSADTRLHGVLPLTPGGDVVAGLDRAGNPLTLRLFRPTATRAVLVGPTITAQLLALRALAAGAQIDVHTEFPQAWEPLLRGLGAAYWDSLRLTPAQARDAEPSAGRPHLVVRESPKTPADDHDESPWCAVLRVSAQPRPELFAGADLAMLHHLDSDDAAVAGDSLGIGTGAAWFSSIGPDMIGVWAGGRTVRWVLLSPTEVERHMISAGSGGPPGMR